MHIIPLMITTLSMFDLKQVASDTTSPLRAVLPDILPFAQQLGARDAEVAFFQWLARSVEDFGKP
jgi:hypothetical protein